MFQFRREGQPTERQLGLHRISRSDDQTVGPPKRPESETGFDLRRGEDFQLQAGEGEAVDRFRRELRRQVHRGRN